MIFDNIRIGQLLKIKVQERAKLALLNKTYTGIVVAIFRDYFSLEMIEVDSIKVEHTIPPISFTFFKTENITMLSCVDTLDIGI